MQKHKLILIVILAAGLLFGLSLLISKDILDPTKGQKGPRKMNIDERIDSFGKLPFNEDSLLTIEGDINTLASISKINSGKKSSLLTNLEYAKQNALVISLKNWLNNSCNSSGLDKVIRSAKACSSKSNELQELLNTHHRFNAVFNFESKLNAFLAGPYDQAKADAISNGISSAINGEPFRNCPSITGLENKINSEISAFYSFLENDYKQKAARGDWDFINQSNLSKYNFYYNEYLKNTSK
jgi:hypothetical protein